MSALSLALEIGAVFDELQKVRETVHKARRRSLSRAPHTPHGEPDPKDVEKWCAFLITAGWLQRCASKPRI